VAFAIGRAIGSSVVRNRLRRRLRAILSSSTDLAPGWYLIGARPAIVELSFDRLEVEVSALLASVRRRVRDASSVS
jgi:ribonuclease P protein component